MDEINSNQKGVGLVPASDHPDDGATWCPAWDYLGPETQAVMRARWWQRTRDPRRAPADVIVIEGGR